jgi:DNA-3-methyladenine glycosylase II
VDEAAIKKHLCKDKKLATLVESIDFPSSKINENLYASLIEAIISQQLSVAAARTIHTRFLALFNNKLPSNKLLLYTSYELLRTAGISNQKAGYLKNIAEFSLANTLNYNDLKDFNDKELITYLTQIKVVGRWTVEMILMFNLNRQDILPLDDLGIQNAIKKLYAIDAKGSSLKSIMKEQAQNWSPYKSVACQYLWRWKDTGK